MTITRIDQMGKISMEYKEDQGRIYTENHNECMPCIAMGLFTCWVLLVDT